MSLTSYRAAPPRVTGGFVGVTACGRNFWGLGGPRAWGSYPVLGRPGGDLLSHVLRRSTIGAEGFHGRVRDGIGCLTPRHSHQVVQAHQPFGESQTAMGPTVALPAKRRKVRALMMPGLGNRVLVLLSRSTLCFRKAFALSTFAVANVCRLVALSTLAFASVCRVGLCRWQSPGINRWTRRYSYSSFFRFRSDEGIKPIERLVRLSFTHCCASTCLLSTWWSTTALKRDLVLRGVSRLDAFSGYPVRT
jgi:hypothetical protein